jgi:hypothetical protein
MPRKGTTPKGTAPKATAPKGTAPKGTASKAAAPKGTKKGGEKSRKRAAPPAPTGAEVLPAHLVPALVTTTRDRLERFFSGGNTIATTGAWTSSSRLLQRLGATARPPSTRSRLALGIIVAREAGVAVEPGRSPAPRGDDGDEPAAPRRSRRRSSSEAAPEQPQADPVTAKETWSALVSWAGQHAALRRKSDGDEG